LILIFLLIITFFSSRWAYQIPRAKKCVFDSCGCNFMHLCVHKCRHTLFPLFMYAHKISRTPHRFFSRYFTQNKLLTQDYTNYMYMHHIKTTHIALRLFFLFHEFTCWTSLPYLPTFKSDHIFRILFMKCLESKINGFPEKKMDLQLFKKEDFFGEFWTKRNLKNG